MRTALAAIDIRVSGESPLVATVPYWRQDIAEEVDMIEEIARGIGYDDIPEVQRGGRAAVHPDTASTTRKRP